MKALEKTFMCQDVSMVYLQRFESCREWFSLWHSMEGERIKEILILLNTDAGEDP